MRWGSEGGEGVDVDYPLISTSSPSMGAWASADSAGAPSAASAAMTSSKTNRVMASSLERSIEWMPTVAPRRGVRPVSVDGHRHVVGRMRHADRPPRAEADAPRLPPTREPADVVGVDVHGEVGLGDEAIHLDGIPVIIRHQEVDNQRRVLGIVADEPIMLGPFHRALLGDRAVSSGMCGASAKRCELGF